MVLESPSNFLTRFKNTVSEKGLTILNRDVNNQSLRKLKIPPLVRKQIILNLEVKNYCKNPMTDSDGSPGEVWIFGHKYENKTIYIKLKLDAEAKCLSFHLAEGEMHFPYEKMPNNTP